jgi:NADH/NAD ratio-sensing transcriptional regulator Rex
MDYSIDLLKEIEKKAKEMMTPTEISFLLDIDETTLKDDINTIGHPARKAFFHGVATTAHEIRENIRDAAMAGSPYSIAECQKQILTMLSDVTI